MALTIMDPETDRLARELAERLGTSITEAVKVALTERLARSTSHVDAVYADLIAIGERGRLRATADPRTAEEMLGYDDHGLPA